MMRKAVMVLAIAVIIMSIWMLTYKDEYEKECLDALKTEYSFSQKVQTGECGNDELCTAAVNKDTSICEEYNGTAQKSCMAIATQDDSHCDEKDCATFMTEQKYKELKKKCRLSATISRAKIERNPEICDRAGSQKQKCLELMKKEKYSIRDL